MASLSEEKKPRKRAVRKSAAAKDVAVSDKKTARAPRKAASSKSVPKKKAVTKKDSPEIKSAKNNSEVIRKAPTSFEADKKVSKVRKQRLLTVVIVLIIGIGASAAVGFTDNGQIDVKGTIEARNERIRNNTATEQDTLISSIEVPVQNTGAKAEKKADGGLILKGPTKSVPKPKVVPDTPVASSTEITASTTESTASGTQSDSLEDSDGGSDTVEIDNIDDLAETIELPADALEEEVSYSDETVLEIDEEDLEVI